MLILCSLLTIASTYIKSISNLITNETRLNLKSCLCHHHYHCWSDFPSMGLVRFHMIINFIMLHHLSQLYIWYIFLYQSLFLHFSFYLFFLCSFLCIALKMWHVNIDFNQETCTRPCKSNYLIQILFSCRHFKGALNSNFLNLTINREKFCL